MRARRRIGAFATLAGVALWADAALLPAVVSATGPQATARQVAGAIPDPYGVPLGVVKVGDALFVLDGSAVDRIDLSASAFSFFAGDRFAEGAADGTGTAARFDHPRGIATDGTDLFVADTGNHTIRRVSLATGDVTTIAGLAGVPGSDDGTGGAARFDEPYGLATDGAGSLWVTDNGNVTIRHVDLDTAAVTTIAGLAGVPGTADGAGEAARFTEPFGIAFDGPRLWVTDGDRVRQVVRSTTRVRTVVDLPPSSEGVSRELTGIASSGHDLYLATPTDDDEEFTSAVLHMAKSTGVVTSFVDPFPSAAYGITSDASDLYVAGDPVLRVDRATAERSEAGGMGAEGTADGVGAAARFSEPLGLVSDGTNLYVSDPAADAIRRVAIASGEVTTVATGLTGPHGLTLEGGVLYVADLFDAIKRVDPATGEVTTFATIDSPGGSASPQDVASDGTHLFVAHADCAIYSVALADGAVAVLAGKPGACGLVDGTGGAARFGFPGCGVCGPAGITTDGTNLYVSDTFNGAIRRVVIATGEVTTLVAPGGLLFRPFGITASAGALYVADPIEFALRKVRVEDGSVSTVASDCRCDPLTYEATQASRTRVSGFYAVAADHGGHRVFFTDITGVGVLEDPHTAI